MPAIIRRREFIVTLCSAATWPLAARSQPASTVPRVGVLWHAGSAEEEGPYFKALVQGFTDRGYLEGKTITFEHRFPNETPEWFKSMAAELVSFPVNVLVSVGNVASPYAKNATRTIPVVFVLVPDPVGTGLVESFARPASNVTGLSTYASDVVGRRLQILKELIPQVSRVAQLVNPNSPASRLHIELTQAAATELGLIVQRFEARTLDDLEPTITAMANFGMQAIMVNPEGLPLQGRAIIPKLALARGLMLCAYSRETFEFGALMSYGVDQQAICRRAAIYVDKILKGTKPAEIPVEGPTKFEFLINNTTAKALGLEVSPVILARADEVIE